MKYRMLACACLGMAIAAQDENATQRITSSYLNAASYYTARSVDYTCAAARGVTYGAIKGVALSSIMPVFSPHFIAFPAVCEATTQIRKEYNKTPYKNR